MQKRKNIKEQVAARIKTDRAFRKLFWKDATQALREYKLAPLTRERVIGYITCLQQKELRASGKARTGGTGPVPPMCTWTAVC